MRPFDVQLLGGMVLDSNRIAEMRTGEGKTLTATLPAYLNGITGKGVHIITVNDYLATRAAENNWQLLDIASQTGHKDVNVLRKHYAKLQGEYLANKIGKK